MSRILKKTAAFLFALMLLPLGVLRGASADFDYTTVPTPHMIVVDGSDPGTVFYERAADEKAYPASTTKIMTCILALESGNLDDTVTIGDEIDPFTSRSSLMGLVKGETVTMRDLVYGLMLVSGNDAAAAIAVHMAGSIDGFASLMNAKAATLGMSNSHFTNPHGTHNDDHYTTARDLAKLTAYALENDQFRQIVATKEYTVAANSVRSNTLTLQNTNKLLVTQSTDTESCLYEYAIGVKTGDTTKAGKCLVAAAEKDGARVIIVLLGDADDAQYLRFHYAISIFEDIFATKYISINAGDLGLQTTFSIPVKNASAEDLPDGSAAVSVDLSATVLRGLTDTVVSWWQRAAEITATVELTSDPLYAPIAENTAIGAVRYTLDGETLLTVPLVLTRAIRETAIMVGTTDDPQATENSGGSLLNPVSPTQKQTDGSGGMSILIWILVGLAALLILLIVIYALIRRQQRIRRRKRRQQQQARMRQQQQQRGNRR